MSEAALREIILKTKTVFKKCINIKDYKKNSNMLTRQWPLRRYTLRLSQET